LRDLTYTTPMASLLLEIFRFPSDRQLPVIAYYVLLDRRPQPAAAKRKSATTAASGYRPPFSSTDFRTAVAQPTPQAALNEMRRKIEQCIEPGDTIDYDGKSYTDVMDVVQAVVRTQPKWQ
jgi:hypothetical protein